MNAKIEACLTALWPRLLLCGMISALPPYGIASAASLNRCEVLFSAPAEMTSADYFALDSGRVIQFEWQTAVGVELITGRVMHPDEELLNTSFTSIDVLIDGQSSYVQVPRSEIVGGSVKVTGANPKYPPIDSNLTNSEIARRDGVSYIYHVTDQKNLSGIFTAHALVPRSHGGFADGLKGGVAETAVYLQLAGNPAVGSNPQFSEKQMVLVFNTEILNRKDYVVNRGWWGGKMAGVSVTADDQIKLHEFLFDVGQHIVFSNEVIFDHDVRLDEGLVAIVVDQDAVTETVAQLTNLGIAREIALSLVKGRDQFAQLGH